jgi:hypothetical protein
MKKKNPSTADVTNPAFYVLITAAAILFILSILNAAIISTDRADELFNALRYKNDWRVSSSFYKNTWEPFRNCGYDFCVLRVPGNLWVALNQFPTSFLIGLVFLPLMIFVAPMYEVFFLSEYTMLLFGWLPFALGVISFVASGIIAETNRVNNKINLSVEDR